MLSLSCFGTEGLLSSKTSLRQEVRVLSTIAPSERKLHNFGATEVSGDSSDEEEIGLSFIEEQLEQQQERTIPEALGGTGDSDLKNEGDVFWTESGAEFQKGLEEDRYSDGGALEDTELNVDRSAKDVDRFEGNLGKHDTGSDGYELLEEHPTLEEAASVAKKDTAAGIKDLESSDQTETSGGVGRVQR